MSIYLYVKTHNLTGLKYLGKTCQDPFKYMGSGKYWLSHLKRYGYDVKTDIIGVFSDNDELKAFSIKYSIENNIVESSEWANLKLEEGDGGAGPFNHTSNKKNAKLGGIAKSKLNLPAWNKGISTGPESSEIRKRKSVSHKGMKRSYREDGSWFWIKPPGQNP